ncbi:MAG TPA: hypothetical protein VM076_08575 [Gemmatimonadaceae bacterium]|nr:hypothetical protein [Gemmatimonadaceae bacterium]
MLRLLSLVFAMAPFGFAMLRFVSTGSDLRMLWMACAAMVGAVIVVAIRKDSSTATSAAIFVVGTLLAGITARLLGATAAAGIWLVAIVLAFCFAASHALAARSRRAGVG